MQEPPFYRQNEAAQKLGIPETGLRDRVFEGQIRPSLRICDFDRAYHLCLYVGQVNMPDPLGNYLLPSTGKLVLIREDGSAIPDDEFFYLRVLKNQSTELNAADPIVVIQSGETPELPRKFSDAWLSGEVAPLPSTPPSRAVQFETLDGSPLAATFIGGLTEELAGVPVRLNRIFISCDLELMFTPDERRQFESDVGNVDDTTAGGESDFLDLEPLKPVTRPQALRASILDALKQLNYDPKAIPQNEPGKAGARKAVRDFLKGKGHISKRAFEKEWQEMRRDKEILDA